MKSLIAMASSSVLVKLTQRKVLRVMIPNQISTWFSQLADVGAKWEWTLG